LKKDLEDPPARRIDEDREAAQRVRFALRADEERMREERANDGRAELDARVRMNLGDLRIENCSKQKIRERKL